MNGYLESQSSEVPGNVIVLSSGPSADVNGSRWSAQPSLCKIQRGQNEQDRRAGQRGENESHLSPCKGIYVEFREGTQRQTGKAPLAIILFPLTISSLHISKSRLAFKQNPKAPFFTSPSPAPLWLSSLQVPSTLTLLLLNMEFCFCCFTHPVAQATLKHIM